MFDDLMGFQGCEFHKKMWPKLVGAEHNRMIALTGRNIVRSLFKTLFESRSFDRPACPPPSGRRFGDVLRLFPTAVPCGVSSHAHGFKMRLNPPDDYELKEGDMLLVIAEDEESYGPTGIPAQVHFEPLPSKVIEKKAEKARSGAVSPLWWPAGEAAFVGSRTRFPSSAARHHSLRHCSHRPPSFAPPSAGPLLRVAP